jgi:hypothetical protein
MAAYAGQGDIRIRIFHFLDLAAAFAQSPDVNITRKENSHQAASGQKQWDGLLLNLNGIAMCQTERSLFFQ